MRNFILKVSSAFLVILLSNCASIIHGPMQAVDFSSQPSGAKVYIDGKEYGETPLTVDLKRRGRLKGESSEKIEYKIKIEMEGYYPYEIKVKRELDGWFLGNIIFGGLIGIIIDASNGSMYKLTPDQIVSSMNRDQAKLYDDETIYISASLKVDPEWEKIGQLEKVTSN